MSSSGLKFFLGILLFGGACSSAEEARGVAATKSLFSVKEFNEFAENLDGEEISIVGFLSAVHPDLEITEDETRGAEPGTPIVVVVDPTLRRAPPGQRPIFEADYLVAKGCTNKFVKLSGIVGLTPSDAIGIVSINRIFVYESEDFDGVATLCFEK